MQKINYINNRKVKLSGGKKQTEEKKWQWMGKERDSDPSRRIGENTFKRRTHKLEVSNQVFNKNKVTTELIIIIYYQFHIT